jgi:hypothetical protein
MIRRNRDRKLKLTLKSVAAMSSYRIMTKKTWMTRLP